MGEWGGQWHPPVTRGREHHVGSNEAQHVTHSALIRSPRAPSHVVFLVFFLALAASRSALRCANRPPRPSPPRPVKSGKPRPPEAPNSCGGEPRATSREQATDGAALATSAQGPGWATSRARLPTPHPLDVIHEVVEREEGEIEFDVLLGIVIVVVILIVFALRLAKALVGGGRPRGRLKVTAHPAAGRRVQCRIARLGSDSCVAWLLKARLKGERE